MRLKKTILAAIVAFALAGPFVACAIAVLVFALTKKDDLRSSDKSTNAYGSWDIPDISDLNPLNKSEHKRKEAGDHGEQLMKSSLQSLNGRVINGYITTKNILFQKKNFEIDFLVLMPQVGLIVVEVKHYSGKVYCSNDKAWTQINSKGERNTYKNASLQSLRTISLLNEMLTSANVNNWPLLSVVVFTHPTANVFKKTGSASPQTDILKRDMFERWLNEQEKNDTVTFTIDDFHKIRNLLKANEHEFSGSTL
ncbi:NERD domain-containing protein [Vibrio sinensis]|uniref:NERD domain-containing protein n=1 Tax=Vibrio sinensis TaxID=2302434 RepID=A0A3A6QF21_9VIBR|nr:nuclease-related domain-containing protein [Vibrio sinensis]RJX68682.1 NERD domain-containing protein [Vibrio sinensis]